MTNEQTLTLLRGSHPDRFYWLSEWLQNGSDLGDRVRLSRESIGFQTFHQPYSTLDQIRQERVQLLQHGMASSAIKAGCSLVIDDENLEEQTVREWMSLADRYFMKFEVVDFGSFPLPELPEATPTEAANGEIYVPNYELPMLYIFDVDGTLARMQGRSPYAYDKAEFDALIANVAYVMHVLSQDHEIAIITGREEWGREHLMRWFEKHELEPDMIFMRPTGDRRPDDVVKLEIFDKHLRNEYHVVGVFDDRRRVCQMWERIGLTLFRVGPMDSDF
jgi:hypothetical protein